MNDDLGVDATEEERAILKRGDDCWEALLALARLCGHIGEFSGGCRGGFLLDTPGSALSDPRYQHLVILRSAGFLRTPPDPPRSYPLLDPFQAGRLDPGTAEHHALLGGAGGTA
jgi:hypothetical protein